MNSYPTGQGSIHSKLWTVQLSELHGHNVREALPRVKAATSGATGILAAMDAESPMSFEQWFSWWYGPPGRSAEASSEASTGVPRVLASWYAAAGRWPGPVIRQNTFHEPEDLRSASGRLLFMEETFGDWAWATEEGGDDPPVYDRRDEDEPWQLLCPRLSIFLNAYWLFDAVMSAPYAAVRARGTAQDVARLRSQMEHVTTVQWRWPATHLQFFRRGRTVALNMFDSPEVFSITVASMSSADEPLIDAAAEPSWSRKHREQPI